MTTYSIVEFYDGLQIVPSSWLRDNKTKSLWPKYTNPDRIYKAVVGREESDEKTWLLLNVRVFGSADKYEAAVHKLNLAKQVTDIDTASDSDETSAKRSRRFRAKRVIPPSNSPSEVDGDCSDELQDINTEKLPFPPKRKRNHPQADVQQTGYKVEEDSTNTPTTTHDGTAIFRKPEIDFRHSIVRKNTDDSCARTSNRDNFVRGESRFPMEENEYVSADKEFKKDMFRKLNAIILKLGVMDEKLNFVLNLHNQKSTADSTVLLESEEGSTSSFPVTSEEEFRKLEKLLADQIRFRQEVNRFKQLGGADVHGCTLTVLKRLLADEVAQCYSWVGMRGNKRAFKDTKLCRLLISTVRANYSEATEKAIENTVSKWLAQSSFRLKRAEQRKLRKQRDVAGPGSNDEPDTCNDDPRV